MAGTPLTIKSIDLKPVEFLHITRRPDDCVDPCRGEIKLTDRMGDAFRIRPDDFCSGSSQIKTFTSDIGIGLFKEGEVIGISIGDIAPKSSAKCKTPSSKPGHAQQSHAAPRSV